MEVATPLEPDNRLTTCWQASFVSMSTAAIPTASPKAIRTQTVRGHPKYGQTDFATPGGFRSKRASSTSATLDRVRTKRSTLPPPTLQDSTTAGRSQKASIALSLQRDATPVAKRCLSSKWLTPTPGLAPLPEEWSIRGEEIPELVGHYFFSDYCGGYLRSFLYADGVATETRDWTEQVGSIGGIISFGRSAAGEVYVMNTETVYRIDPVR